jgi:selenocysteine lyase/cysteine desulfurase
MNKREFLQGFGGFTLAALVGQSAWARWSEMPAAQLAQEDEFWRALRGQYRAPDDIVQLENGYYSMMAQPVLEAYLGHLRTLNVESSRYMRTKAEEDNLRARKALARAAGCSHEELVVTRNTTESLDLVIAGHDWKPGDEAVMAETDYGAMLDMFEQEARRHGLVNKRVLLPLDPRSDEELVELYASAITPRTKLLMVCHVANITGQVLPVAKICAMARSKGVATLVDGAHAFAQLEFRLDDLGCDYYGTSLHKWLGCPLGAGFLYVRRERVPGLWPLFASSPKPADDITRLNHTGTLPCATLLAIHDALAFHEQIGVARKEARLRHLQGYWTSRVRGLAKVRLNTPSAPARTCGIANVGLEGLAPSELARQLLERFGIYTVAIDRANVQGVRVTPHLYTTEADLDKLVAALRELAG